MKVLFSADWHLGYTLGGANPALRLEDQARQLRMIAAYCDEYAVEVLAIVPKPEAESWLAQYGNPK